MRIWLSGPRILNGLVRPGVSFGPEDFRRMRAPAIAEPPDLLDKILIRSIAGAALVIAALAIFVAGAFVWALII